MGTPSLLLTLLKDERQEHPSTQLGNNVKEVVDSIEKNNPSLAKNVAQQKLYEALYSIIKEEYAQDSIFNKAIGSALESAIREAEQSDTIMPAIPGERQSSVITVIAGLPFRKHS